ncbi:MAG: sigma factor-like helix-turn-helix DNA-binding protein, partial [Myxococcota bacterium]|nr:sigma factor-like helix-turn-helix DNA-binding protein [Myxococcota bacterium]
ANTRAGRKLFFQLERERNKLLQLHGEATTKQLSEVLDVSEKEIETITMLKWPTLSLHAPLLGHDGESRMIEETLPSEGPGVEESFARTELAGQVAEEMERFVSQITDEREQQIWHDRLISEDPLSLSELGRRFGVSRERVRQLEERLKRRFKEHLSEKIGEELILELTEDI